MGLCCGQVRGELVRNDVLGHRGVGREEGCREMMVGWEGIGSRRLVTKKENGEDAWGGNEWSEKYFVSTQRMEVYFMVSLKLLHFYLVHQ